MYLDEKKQGEVAQPTLSPVGKIIWEAADYIEKYGWIQGKAFTNSPEFMASSDDISRYNRQSACAWGALSIVALLHQTSFWAIESFLRYLQNQGFVTISSWNDAPGRTKKQVIEALRDAAIQETY